MNNEVSTLMAVAVVYVVVYAVGETARKAALRLPWALGVILLAPLMTVAIGWMAMVLWNLSVPQLFGLPEIGLVPAIALVWLSGLLVRGVAPRAVYDVDEADR